MKEQAVDSRFSELQKHIDALFKSTDEAYGRVSKAQGISSSASDILYALSIYGDGLTQKQICDYSYSNKQTINSTIHKLEKQGVLEMRAGHGRERLISLTERGEKLARRVVLPVVKAEHEALASIPENLREPFIEIADNYAAALTAALDEVARKAQLKEEA